MSVRRLRSEVCNLSIVSKGNFYFFKCNEDILSGYALDCPPGAIYVWRFILPSFDLHEFLHLSLASRILSADTTAQPDLVISQLQNDWSLFSATDNARDLLESLNSQYEPSLYRTWVAFLTLCRVQDFRRAEEFTLDSGADKALSDWGVVRDRYADLKRRLVDQDHQGIGRLLDSWSSQTRHIYCARSS